MSGQGQDPRSTDVGTAHTQTAPATNASASIHLIHRTAFHQPRTGGSRSISDRCRASSTARTTPFLEPRRHRIAPSGPDRMGPQPRRRDPRRNRRAWRCAASTPDAVLPRLGRSLESRLFGHQPEDAAEHRRSCGHQHRTEGSAGGPFGHGRSPRARRRRRRSGPATRSSNIAGRPDPVSRPSARHNRARSHDRAQPVEQPPCRPP